MIFHHEGVVAEDLEQELEIYKTLGFEEESRFEDETQQVRGVFMEKDGMRVELLQPLSEKSPLHSYIKRGVKIYHHAFKTRDLDGASLYLQNSGFMQVGPPQVSIAFGGKIAFFLSPTMLLVELIEDQNPY